MCGHAPSPRQTAACLSQVIFVKQLLLSHFFFPELSSLYGQQHKAANLGKEYSQGVHGFPKCVLKRYWQQNESF